MGGIDAAETKGAPYVVGKECFTDMVSGIDEHFARTILRREGMSTALTLTSGPLEEDKDEPNRKYPEGGTMKLLFTMPEVFVCS